MIDISSTQKTFPDVNFLLHWEMETETNDNSRGRFNGYQGPFELLSTTSLSLSEALYPTTRYTRCKLLIEHDGEHVATKHSINYRKQYQVLTTDDDFIAFEKNDKTAYQSILPDTLSDVFTFGGANREWNSKRIDE